MNKWMEELSKELLENRINYTYRSIGSDTSSFEFIVSEESAKAAKAILEKHTPSTINTHLTRG